MRTGQKGPGQLILASPYRSGVLTHSSNDPFIQQIATPDFTDELAPDLQPGLAPIERLLLERM